MYKNRDEDHLYPTEKQLALSLLNPEYKTGSPSFVDQTSYDHPNLPWVKQFVLLGKRMWAKILLGGFIEFVTNTFRGQTQRLLWSGYSLLYEILMYEMSEECQYELSALINLLKQLSEIRRQKNNCVLFSEVWDSAQFALFQLLLAFTEEDQNNTIEHIEQCLESLVVVNAVKFGTASTRPQAIKNYNTHALWFQKKLYDDVQKHFFIGPQLGLHHNEGILILPSLQDLVIKTS